MHLHARESTRIPIAAIIYPIIAAKKQYKAESGGTALHAAAHGGEVDAIAALIKAGADVNAKDKNSKTAVHDAAHYGYVDAIAA